MIISSSEWQGSDIAFISMDTMQNTFSQTALESHPWKKLESWYIDSEMSTTGDAGLATYLDSNTLVALLMSNVGESDSSSSKESPFLTPLPIVCKSTNKVFVKHLSLKHQSLK